MVNVVENFRLSVSDILNRILRYQILKIDFFCWIILLSMYN